MKLEGWQKTRVDLIKSLLPNFGDNYILKGGTALTLFYGCDRYSDDIDLDCLSPNMDIIDRIVNPGFDTWNITLRKDTDTVFRIMIDYGGNNGLGPYPLKIEISSINREKLLNGRLEYKKMGSVNVYSLKEIYRMKCLALSGRTTSRDFFDIGYILRERRDLVTKEKADELLSVINYRGIDAEVMMLTANIVRNKIADIDPEEYVLETLEILEEIVDSKEGFSWWLFTQTVLKWEESI